jgi:methylmalonyl-CoA mutase N-terminal domain/subunit
VETLTNRLEQEAEEIFAAIDAQGGTVEAIEKGWFQREIHKASYRYQQEIEKKQRIIVGGTTSSKPTSRRHPHPLHRPAGREGPGRSLKKLRSA